MLFITYNASAIIVKFNKVVTTLSQLVDVTFRVETNIRVLECSISNDSTRVLNFCSATRRHGFVVIKVNLEGQLM